MSLAAQLNSSTVLTPKERERSKTAQQRAEDVIYTLNHALTCLSVTDFVVAPAIGAITASMFGEKNRVTICGHDHSHDKKIVSREAEQQFLSKLVNEDAKPKQRMRYGKVASSEEIVKSIRAQERARTPFLKRMGNWLKERSTNMRDWVVGEVAGDVGAVFITVGIQRFLPGMMDVLHSAMEPLFGGIFKHGSQRAARKWGEKHGYAVDSQEVVERAQELYRYEMRHLPQMAVWTAASIAINYGVMKKLNPQLPLSLFIKGKAVGSAVTAGLVFGTRAAMPDKAHTWDQTVGKNVIVPATKKIGKVFGIEERDVDAYHERQREDDTPKSWASRVEKSTAVNAEAVRA